MNFIYKKIASSYYGTTAWLKVSQFRDNVQSMIDSGETINNTSILPIMNKIIAANEKHADIDGVPEAVLYNAMREVRRGSYNEKEFTAKFGELCNNEDYVVNPLQMDRLFDIVQFFTRANNVADPVGFSAKERDGNVTATFAIFNICGDEVKNLCKVLKPCSAVSINIIGDSMQISCTIPNIFVEKGDEGSEEMVCSDD